MLITVKIKKAMPLKNVIFLLMLLKSCMIFSQLELPKKIIVIDPGHGGEDSGAMGINGILEKEVVLNIAKEIIRLNQSLFEDKYDIYLTKYKDTLISLGDRTSLAKTLSADILVSLHCNASVVVSKGMEVYVSDAEKEEVNIKESIGLGLSILNESTRNLGLKKRGVKFANFQVLRETIGFCPAVLIETGFVTSSDEANYFLEPKNIKAMAMAILVGMYNYLNI